MMAMAALGEVSGNGLSRDKAALRKLAAAILVLTKVMDAKGNKVLVCDNGTGVRSISFYTAGSDVNKRSILF